MSASQIVIEEESGTYSGRRPHPHNGYYAGDFWADRRIADDRAEGRR
ncbi:MULTISPECIES: hypothetical protein [unclassified Nocardioides]